MMLFKRKFEETLLRNKVLFLVFIILISPFYFIGESIMMVVDFIRGGFYVPEMNYEKVVNYLLEKYNISNIDVLFSSLDLSIDLSLNGLYKRHFCNGELVKEEIHIKSNRITGSFSTTIKDINIIFTTLHEIAHIIQYRSGKFMGEFNNYINAKEDYYQYQQQRIEIDADRFAYIELIKNLGLLFKKEYHL